jgi:hypothetical protein
MTWPIDVAEELKELDEDRVDSVIDFATLLQAQRTYKAALLEPGVLAALLAIMTPSLAKSKRCVVLISHFQCVFLISFFSIPVIGKKEMAKSSM